MADQVDAYGPEYEKQLFEKLAPEVEAMVAKMFPQMRGARFGAQGAILTRRLAALRTEIALDTAKKNVDQQEKIRQETRQERLYNERKSTAVGDRAMQETRARSDQAMAQMRQDRMLEDQKKWQLGLKYGFTPEELKQYGRDPNGAPNLYDKPQQAVAPQRGFLKDYTDVNNRDDISRETDNLISGDTSLRGRTFSTPTQAVAKYGSFDSGPGSYADASKSGGFYDAYKAPHMASPSYPEGYGNSRPPIGGPGDITPDTFGKWPKKYFNDTKNTFKDTYSGFLSLKNIF